MRQIDQHGESIKPMQTIGQWRNLFTERYTSMSIFELIVSIEMRIRVCISNIFVVLSWTYFICTFNRIELHFKMEQYKYSVQWTATASNSIWSSFKILRPFPIQSDWLSDQSEENGENHRYCYSHCKFHHRSNLFWNLFRFFFLIFKNSIFSFKFNLNSHFVCQVTLSTTLGANPVEINTEPHPL